MLRVIEQIWGEGEEEDCSIPSSGEDADDISTSDSSSSDGEGGEGERDVAVAVGFRPLPLGPAWPTAPTAYEEDEQGMLDDPSSDDEGDDGGEDAAAAFAPLPLFPGWASQGAKDRALEYGRAAVAEGGRRGANYCASIKLEEDADDDHLAKIGSVMMDIEWLFGASSNVTTGGKVKSAAFADDLDIDSLLKEARESPENAQNKSLDNEEYRQSIPTTTAQLDVAVTDERPVVTDDEATSLWHSEDDGNSDYDVEQISSSWRVGRSRKQQCGKVRGSSLSVRLQQLRLCGEDLRGTNRVDVLDTATNDDASVERQRGRQVSTGKANVGRRISSLAAELLREIVAHLGKKGVIVRGIF